MTTVRPLAELRRAWIALEAGQFAEEPPPGVPNPEGVHRWLPEPGEQVALVVACPGVTGATTVAVALADGAASARILECAPVEASGLTAACSAELGSAFGWLRGRRQSVLVERCRDPLDGPGEVPAPTVAASHPLLTVIDVGWTIRQVMATPGWLRDQFVACTGAVVAVTAATAPGLRQLEILGGSVTRSQLVAAVIGPDLKKWPVPARQALGDTSHRLLAEDRLVTVPVDRRLAATGLTSDPLPPSLQAAGRRLLQILNEGDIA